MTAILTTILWWAYMAALVYLLTVAAMFFLMAASAAIEGRIRARQSRNEDFDTLRESPFTIPVSIIAPAFNEAVCIVPAVNSLLALSYPEYEVIVVNDGSSDTTLDTLITNFELKPIGTFYKRTLAATPIRQLYRSERDPRLLVIDKPNGGKADSLNCGIRYAAYPLFCAIDSDTLLDAAALARLVWNFQSEPETVATGGIVRIINGSLLEDGRIRSVRTPENTLVNVQIVEYLRAFLAGRAGWSRVNMLLIISGAFGLFRRETVVEAGGYDTSTVGEDAELVVRLHRHCRDQRRKYKITFVADPICWTEAPAERSVLERQRDRWQRGLLETLWRHRRMFANPRYGGIGMIAMPFFLFFEALGPVVEISGLAYCVIGLMMGWVNPPFAAVLFGLAFTYGLVLSFGALLIEGRAFARYPGWRDLRRLMVAAVVENFGYRQWLAIVRTKALWTVLRPNTGWGEMTRVGFSEPVPAVAPGISSGIDG